MKPPQRLDITLTSRGLCDSRAKAQALIKAGHVFCNGQAMTKAHYTVPEGAVLEVRGQEHPWVSRAGMKLAHALGHFQLNPKGMLAVDIGASTGGFTDVLLQHGASKVFAVDVGHDQLALRLRQDARVVNIEGCNARYITEEELPEPLDMLVCDASFISLTKLLPAPIARLKETAWLVALIKPQFEVGKERIPRDGVVKDPALQEEICQTIRQWFTEHYPHWECLGLTESPIQGPDGNREFLIGYRAQPTLSL